jgi:hypothetical protein
MVANCANPNCFATFHYLHEGKLFVVDEHAATLRATSHPPRCFWLCSQCSRTLTVVYDAQDEIRLIPAPTAARRHTSCEVFPCGSHVIHRLAVTNQQTR